MIGVSCCSNVVVQTLMIVLMVNYDFYIVEAVIFCKLALTDYTFFLFNTLISQVSTSFVAFLRFICFNDGKKNSIQMWLASVLFLLYKRIMFFIKKAQMHPKFCTIHSTESEASSSGIHVNASDLLYCDYY